MTQPVGIETCLVEIIWRRLAAVDQADPWCVARFLEVLPVVDVDFDYTIQVWHRDAQNAARLQNVEPPFQQRRNLIVRKML
ncbi:hypothetical protein D3C87_2046330 [compost metagenome]